MEELAKELYSACFNENLERVKQLLHPKIDINWQNNDGRTPFWISCYYGHFEVVKLLLSDERVDVNKSDQEKKTPFYVACQDGCSEIVKLLLSDKRVDVNQTDNYGTTPLFISCQNDRIEVVKLLLNDKRINVNQGDRNKWTPLWIASSYEHLEIVKYILANGRDIDVNAKVQSGYRAIDIAREKQEEEKESWESDIKYEESTNYDVIIELLESFEINPNETRTRLRLQLGFAGKICIFISMVN